MSFAEFISMGGYGLYVWSSFGMTALLMIGEVVILRRQRRTIIQRLCRMSRIEKRPGATP